MYMVNGHARIRKDFLRVVHFYVYFWLKRGERILLSECHYKRAIIGPQAKRHLNGVSWCANDDPTLNVCLAGLSFSGGPDQYCYETLYYVIFQGGGGSVRTTLPQGSAHGENLSELAHFLKALNIYTI